MSLEKEMQLEGEYLMPTFSRYPVEFVAGKGMRLIDSEGKVYLDFLSGIGVCSLGHCHPALVEAVKDQASQLVHVGNYFYIGKRGEVAKRLSDMLSRACDCDEGPGIEGAGAGVEGAGARAAAVSAGFADDVCGAVEDASAVSTTAAMSACEPYSGTWKTFFANSGAEANECAIKLARIHHGRRNSTDAQQLAADQVPLVVTLKDSFHGRTLASLASTGQPRLHQGFEPMPEGFVFAPINDICATRDLFAQHGSRICAVMVECIQGESGIHPCSGGFLREVRRLCSEASALMICDEVQSGIYRTGRPFAFQHFGLVPDVVTMAKGMASGMPVGACSARAAIADEMGPGTHGSTFGGSCLAMAAAEATLSQLDQPGTENRINEVGDYLRSRLLEIPQVVETRGYGLMCAAELANGIDSHDVVAAALEEGAVVNAPRDTTLRFLPPLVCTKQDVDELIGILASALAKLSQ